MSPYHQTMTVVRVSNNTCALLPYFDCIVFSAQLNEIYFAKKVLLKNTTFKTTIFSKTNEQAPQNLDKQLEKPTCDMGGKRSPNLIVGGTDGAAAIPVAWGVQSSLYLCYYWFLLLLVSPITYFL